MAIRIRRSGCVTIALCAAETDPATGDLYLDDAMHEALSAKFEQDFASMGLIVAPSAGRPQSVEMERHRVRDAEIELDAWLAVQRENQPA